MGAHPLQSILIAVGRIGARAAAAGVASALKDVDRFTTEAQRRLRQAQQGLDAIAAHEDKRNR
jgi:hypothetical protein